jgi:hypothetical protein
MRKIRPTDNCDICFKENEEIFGDCCGIKMCIECDSKLGGLCSICEKDELNFCYECYGCYDDVPRMNTHICQICEEIFCEDCLSINDAPCFVCLRDKCENKYYDDFIIWASEKLLKKISTKRIQKKWKEFKSTN